MEATRTAQSQTARIVHLFSGHMTLCTGHCKSFAQLGNVKKCEVNECKGRPNYMMGL